MQNKGPLRPGQEQRALYLSTLFKDRRGAPVKERVACLVHVAVVKVLDNLRAGHVVRADVMAQAHQGVDLVPLGNAV